MSIENITTKIKHEAEERARVLKEQAQQRKVVLEAETTEVSKELQRDAAQALEKKQEQRKAVRLSLAKQTQHIALQAAKRTALNAVLQDAYKQLAQASADQYVTAFTTFAKQQHISPEEIRAVQAPADRTAETEQILQTLQVTASVEYSDTLAGGVVLHGDDYAIDLSLDRLYNDATPALEGVAAKILFAAK